MLKRRILAPVAMITLAAFIAVFMPPYSWVPAFSLQAMLRRSWMARQGFR